MANKKVILAFSGGLDTSFCVLWLKGKGYEVITVTVDTGGLSEVEIKNIAGRARELGVVKHITIEAKKEFYEKMLNVLQKLTASFAVWQYKYSNSRLGKPNMNITGLCSSTQSMNNVPDEVTASLDIRTTPELHSKIESLIKKILGGEAEVTGFETGKPPGYTKTGSHIVKCFQKILPGIPLSISMGSTDLSQFTQRGIEAVVFGPGDKRVIHKADEFVRLSKVEECVKIYKKIIEEY